jgi:antitoxin (DNA-binding transcriptional repressor) of toxin-antitoxin stability system
MQNSLSEARNQLSKLTQAALAGEDVVIARNGIPLVSLVKVNTPDTMRKPGAWADLPTAAVDWDVPVSLSKDPDLQKVPRALMRASERRMGGATRYPSLAIVGYRYAPPNLR